MKRMMLVSLTVRVGEDNGVGGAPALLAQEHGERGKSVNVAVSGKQR